MITYNGWLKFNSRKIIRIFWQHTYKECLKQLASSSRVVDRAFSCRSGYWEKLAGKNRWEKNWREKNWREKIGGKKIGGKKIGVKKIGGEKIGGKQMAGKKLAGKWRWERDIIGYFRRWVLKLETELRWQRTSNLTNLQL